MAKSDDHVLPRPVEALPDYSLAKGRSNTSESLVEKFKFSPEAAQCLADAAVDPTDLRKSLDHPIRMPVPGGTLIGVRTQLWARKVFPDPRNPRLGPARRHPFAINPGTDEASLFTPVPDPTSEGTSPELHVEIENRQHLTWASDLAKKHVLQVNDWTDSIRVQGVMTDVWVVATRYHHTDGTPDLWAATTAEGSSRITATHAILGIRSVDEAYDTRDKQMRATIKQRNELHMRGTDRALEETMRAERVPALIIVAFEPHPGGTAHFSTAIKSLVALRHVDPPTPWGTGPENESLADACLEELERQDLISPVHRRWLGGSLTREEAEAAHLSRDAATRAAWIAHTFTNDENGTIFGALRLAVTSQSTRKRITQKLRRSLATALIVRALAPGAAVKVDRIRRYLPEAFSEVLQGGYWKPTFRTADELLEAALTEHRQDSDPDRSALSPSRRELATRAAYALIASLSLFADKGSANNDQPDRRTPSAVIDRMTRSEQGLRQLHRALVDYTAGNAIRVVDTNGEFQLASNQQQVRLSDRYLRSAYSAPGKIIAPGSVDTATDQLQQALSDFGTVVDTLERAKTSLEAIDAGDGSPLIARDGVPTAHVDAWRKILRDVDDALNLWGTTYRLRMKTTGLDQQPDDEGLDEEDEASESEEHDSDEEVA